MKIIEGTPEEVREYLRNQEIKKTENWSDFALAVKKEIRKVQESHDNISRWELKNRHHWSSTKREWIPIQNMDKIYILNAIKKMLRENSSNDWLLTEDEFKSLIVNLADKIIEEL